MQTSVEYLLSFESIALLVGGAVVLALVYLDYRREELLIETGYYDEDVRDDLTSFFAHRRLDGALAVGFAVVGYGVGRLLDDVLGGVPGLVPVAVGASLIGFYLLLARSKGDDETGSEDGTNDGDAEG